MSEENEDRCCTQCGEAPQPHGEGCVCAAMARSTVSMPGRPDPTEPGTDRPERHVKSGGLRAAYYRTSEGLTKLCVIRTQIKDADPEFDRRVQAIVEAVAAFKQHIDAKYRWD